MQDGVVTGGELEVADAAPNHGGQSVSHAVHDSPVWWPGSDSDSGSERVRRAVAGTLLARPWFDRIALSGLKHVMFPASRLWAAAQLADGDLEQFLQAVPMAAPKNDPYRLTRSLAAIAQTRVAAEAMDAEWQRVFFGDRATTALHRRATEAARLDLRHANHASRWPLRARLRADVPRARLAIETPEAVAAIYGGGRATFNRLASPPERMPEVEQSRSFPTPLGVDYWLRFGSPSARLGDTVYARVHEPIDSTNAPTIIFGHGICVEFDQWKGLLDECRALVQRGFRVIRPEAPWHGRRAPVGYFGGERTIGAFPMGLLDSFAGALQEWAVLTDWVRQRSAAPVVYGGSSLGAMTAQLAAVRAGDGPARLRPDALFLVTHTGDMAAAVMDGALSTLWAKPADIEQAGWTRESARDFLSLINPEEAMPLPGHRIVSILGRRDKILPFESGRLLVQRWKVPAANGFIWDRGHFSVPTTLIRSTAPLDRLAQVVGKI